MTKICCTCKQEKPLTSFGGNKSKRDRKQNYCKDCGKVYDRRHYAKNPNRKQAISECRSQARVRNREYVIQYLLEHPCVDCGETEPIFLEFDHIGDDKVLEVGSMVHTGWALGSIRAEIAKCEVRCLKCHKIKTAMRAGWYDEYVEMKRRYGASGNTPLL